MAVLAATAGFAARAGLLTAAIILSGHRDTIEVGMIDAEVTLVLVVTMAVALAGIPPSLARRSLGYTRPLASAQALLD